MTLTPVTIRIDKKCGSSGIPDNATCTKGQGGTPAAVQSAGPRKRKIGVGGILGIAAGAGLVAGTYSAIKEREKAGKAAVKSIKRLKAKSNDVLLASLKTAKELGSASMYSDPASQKRFIDNINEAKLQRGMGRAVARAGITELKNKVMPSRARLRGALKGKRDSVWAEGF